MRRIPDDEDAAFSFIVLDILSVPFTVMTVQSELGAEAALAKKA
jgi:ABC-type methionine transport system permease subunit